jgi:hypothetical protein
MFILKLAMITCAIYMGFALLFLVSGLVFGPWKSVIGYNTHFRAWAILFGLMWFVSFIIAWRIAIYQTLNAFKAFKS